jgi:hypothetical protein
MEIRAGTVRPKRAEIALFDGVGKGAETAQPLLAKAVLDKTTEGAEVAVAAAAPDRTIAPHVHHLQPQPQRSIACRV